MRKLKNKPADFAYFLYRLVLPVIDPIWFYYGVTGYFWYIRDLIKYQILDPKAKLLSINMYPRVDEKLNFSRFDAHYFHQQLWAFERILKAKPKMSVDIGSSYHFCGYISKIAKSEFVDIRPIQTELENLKVVRGSILDLPYETSSIESMSCLHVAEHIGLGRYGDPIDPQGTVKACEEMSRVLAVGGKLYFTLPTGKNRICFNAHRVHSPETILSYFEDLTLEEFSVVDDNDKLILNAKPEDYNNAHYACGMYVFTKKAKA